MRHFILWAVFEIALSFTGLDTIANYGEFLQNRIHISMDKQKIEKVIVNPATVAYVVAHSGWIALKGGEHLNPLYYEIQELSPPPAKQKRKKQQR